jgi:hypothetical protein
MCGEMSGFRFVSTQDYENVKSTWIKSIKERPIEYIKFRMAAYWRFLTQSDPFTFYKIKNDVAFFSGGAEIDDLGFMYLTSAVIDDIRPSALLESTRASYIRSYSNISLRDFGIIYRPYFWLIVGIMLFVYHRTRLSRLTKTYSGLAILSSGLIYLLTYLPSSNSYEFRFIYYTIVSICVSSIISYIEISKEEDISRK